MHTNAKIIFLVAAGTVGITVFAVVLFWAPGPAGLGVGLVGYTNGWATLTVTNLSRFRVYYHPVIERDAAGSWVREHVALYIQGDGYGLLRAREVATFGIPVHVYEPPRSWRWSILCLRPSTSFERLRKKASIYLFRLKMENLGQQMWPDGDPIQADGPAMEQ